VAYPEKFAYPRAEVTLSGHADLRPPDDGIRPAIGTIYANSDVIQFYVFLPENDMAELVAAASSGRIRQINFTGTPLKWRKGTVSNVSVSTEVDEADGGSIDI